MRDYWQFECNTVAQFDWHKQKKKVLSSVGWTFLRMPQSLKMDILYFFFSLWEAVNAIFDFLCSRIRNEQKKALSRMRVCQFIARFFRHVTGEKNVPPQVASHSYAGTPKKWGPVRDKWLGDLADHTLLPPLRR